MKGFGWIIKVSTDLALSGEDPELCCRFLGRPGPRCLSLKSITPCHINGDFPASCQL